MELAICRRSHIFRRTLSIICSRQEHVQHRSIVSVYRELPAKYFASILGNCKFDHALTLDDMLVKVLSLYGASNAYGLPSTR
jgi:hypothetical protein